MWATEEGTRRFFEKTPIEPSKQRNFDGLIVSALGVGTYLGLADEETDRLYERVLFLAAQGGVNFFDTSINYRCMRSERVLGRVLAQLHAQGLPREALVIASKGGYIPCEGPSDQFEDFLRAKYLDTKVVEGKDIVANNHCISPSFLSHQIEASLEHLKIQCLDLYYLHNPETQLLEVGEEEFYERLFLAFSLFEKKIEEGKIRRYGLATWNGFRQKKGGLQFGRVLAAAKRAGGEGHHFRAIQLPYNLVMLEAIKEGCQSGPKEKKTFMQMSDSAHIAIMVSAPLMQSKVSRLSPRLFEKLPEAKTPMLQSLEFVLSTPSLTTAFVGMKQEKHWEENREALFTPTWSEEVWKKACLSLGINQE